MFIRVRDLETQDLDFKEEFRPGTIDFGSELQLRKALKSSGRAELIEEQRGQQVVRDIRLVGDFSTRVAIKCARCLEAVERDVSSNFDLLYRPLGVDRRAAEVEISRADTEIGYYAGEGVLLEDVLKELVLLSVPMKIVCREDCKGFCPRCGRNLNYEACNCPPPPSDARWAALEELKKKLES